MFGYAGNRARGRSRPFCQLVFQIATHWKLFFFFLLFRLFFRVFLLFLFALSPPRSTRFEQETNFRLGCSFFVR